jgi:hypothetical protein
LSAGSAKYASLKKYNAETTGGTDMSAVFYRITSFYAPNFNCRIERLANQNDHMFDNEGYGKFLEELLNLDGETELGRARWSTAKVS